MIAEWNGKERCVVLGEYLLEKQLTVRAVAGIFGISKSTVHKDVTKPKGDFFVFLADGNP